MRPIQALCVLALALCPSAAALADDLSVAGDPESLGFSSARLARITSWYQERVDSRDVPGVVVAIARNGKLAYLKAVGFQDRGKQIPMRLNSIFWIASMTKPITSVAAMILAEEGKLDLDAPVPQYLPELKDMQVATEKIDAATGKMDLVYEAQKRPMTVRDLLRHTSGLIYPPQYISSPVHRLYSKAVFKRNTTLADFVTSLGKLPLAHQPGEVWEYSWGVDVLARIVEVQSGQSFDQFLENRIFPPLHMVDTGFYVPDDKLGHLVDPPGEQREALWDLTTRPKLFSGGGGLASTALDYMRFCQMLLNGGELDGARILKQETVQSMTTNSLPPDIHFAMDFIGPSEGSSWGLGFAIRTDPENSRVPGSVGSFMWSGAGGTYFWVDPAEKLIAVEMIQTDGKDIYSGALRRLTYGALKEPEVAPPPTTSAKTAENLADYAGVYDFGSSTSAADKRAGFAETGVASASLSDGALKIIGVADGSPAAKAGIAPGDLVIRIDDVAVKDMTPAQVLAKARGVAGSEVQMKVLHRGQEPAEDVVVSRAPIRSREVELRVRVAGGRLTIEATGAWPILDFDKGKPVEMAAGVGGVFYVDGGDHTRIAFVQDSAGKVSGAILNPGPWQQESVMVEREPG